MTRRGAPSAAVPAPAGGLLTVHAHPDDETLSNGALLATWAAAGLPVTVVTCTRGEQGEVIGATLAHLEGDGPALAAHREHEVAAALDALGVHDHLFLDSVPDPLRAPRATGVTADARPETSGERYVDSGMAWAATGRATSPVALAPGAFVTVPLDDAAARLAVVLRDRRPEVVVCDEPGGGYGHPDHVRAHRVVGRALELAAQDAHLPGAPLEVPVALWTVLDETALRSAYAALAAVAGSSDVRSGPDPAGPVPSAAVPSADVDVVVRVAPVLARVLAALRAHATQVQAVQAAGVPVVTGTNPVVAVYALSNDVLAPVLPTETYRYAPGSPLRPVHWPAGVDGSVTHRGA